MLLTTERLWLKPHTLANLPKLNAWESDPEICYYDDDDPEPVEQVPLETTRRHLEKMVSCDSDDGSLIHLAIHRRADDAFIGICMIAHIDRHNRRCSVGIEIGEKGEWGKGYGREAVSALIAHCFGPLGMNRIDAEVYAFNARSVRLFEGLGFKREGVLREHVLKRGRFEDSYVLGLLAREWRNKSAR